MKPLVALEPIRHPELGIESFPSYLRRVAGIYRVSLHQLLRYICESREISDLVDEAPIRSTVTRPRVLSGYAAFVRTLTKRAAAATGVDGIAATTLQRIGPALSSIGTGAVVPRRRYCILCLRGAKPQEGFAWEPLAWALPTLTCCPMHGMPLHFASNEWDDLNKIDEPNQDRFIQQERGSNLEPWLRAESLKLMAFCAAEPNHLVSDGAAQLFLNTYIQHRHMALADFCQLTGLSHGNIGRQAAGTTGITLKMVFVIAQRLALSPIEILAEPVETAKSNSLFCIADHGEIAALHGTHPRRGRQVHKALLAEIRALLASKRSLPSFRSVCHKRGVSTGFARHRMPLEAAEFNARRRRELMAERCKRRRQAISVAKQALRIEPSRSSLKRTEQRLRKKTGLSKRLLSAALRGAQAMVAS